MRKFFLILKILELEKTSKIEIPNSILKIF